MKSLKNHEKLAVNTKLDRKLQATISLVNVVKKSNIMNTGITTTMLHMYSDG